MSEEEYIDFKKEFKDFKKELENSVPLFDEDIEFTDFDDMIKSDSDFLESDNDFENFPSVNIEDENVSLSFIIKKDYSQINDLNERKKILRSDLNALIEEFSKTDEFMDLLEYFNLND